MSNMGTLGWVSDKAQGYRYQAIHPTTKQNWPTDAAQLIAGFMARLYQIRATPRSLLDQLL